MGRKPPVDRSAEEAVSNWDGAPPFLWYRRVRGRRRYLAALWALGAGAAAAGAG